MTTDMISGFDRPLCCEPMYEHQEDLVKQTWYKEAWALFLDQGLGKTRCIIESAMKLWEADELEVVLVVTINGVQHNWIQDELPKFHTLAFSAFTWESSLYKTPKQVENFKWAIEREIRQRKGPIWLGANVETLRLKRAQDLFLDFLKNNKSMFVVDESTIIKTYKARQTRVAIALGQHANYRRILTGTPITSKGAEDLFSQIKFLGEKYLPCPTLTAFRNKFCEMKEQHIPGGSTIMRSVGVRNENVLREWLFNFSTRVKKEDALNLPEKVYKYIYVDLTPEQKKAYNEIAEEQMTLLQEKLITLPNIISALTKLRQVVCGFVHHEFDDVIEIPSNRIKILKEHLETLPRDDKAIIWVAHLFDVDKLTEELGEACVPYCSEQNSRERRFALEQMQNNDTVRYLVATTAAAYGLNIISASHNFYYSNTYSLEKRLQNEDRTHRIGQTKTVLYYDMVARGTSDEKIIKAFRKHKDVSTKILQEYVNWLKPL